MQEDHADHAVRGPAVHVAQERAEGHRAAQVEHAVVGLRGGRHVVEHQQNAGDHQNQEQEERHQPEPDCVERAQRVPVHFDRMDVQEEVREARRRTLVVIGWQRVAKHRMPCVGGQFQHGRLVNSEGALLGSLIR